MLFDTIFVPGANRLLETGWVPGRPDIRYRWAHDEATATFTALVDGEWRPLTGGSLHGNAFLDERGEAVAVSTTGPDGRRTLVTSVDVLDRAVAELKSGGRRSGLGAVAGRSRAEALPGSDARAENDQIGDLDPLPGIRQRTTLRIGD